MTAQTTDEEVTRPMAGSRRMICSECEYQAPSTEFEGQESAVECPRCGSDHVRFADYEAPVFGGLTGPQWELVRELAGRELRSGLLLVGQQEELQAIVTTVEEVALPAIAAIDQAGVIGYLRDKTRMLAEEDADAEENGGPPAGDWVDEAREELLAAIEASPRPPRESLIELVYSLCEAYSERETEIIASVAVAAGLGGELEGEFAEDQGTNGGPERREE